MKRGFFLGLSLMTTLLPGLAHAQPPPPHSKAYEDAVRQMQLEMHNVPFEQNRLQALVEAVEAMGVKSGEEEIEMRFDRMDDPQSLRLRRPGPSDYIPRGQEAGNVWASRDSNGNLTVIILTKDFGHAGQFGYAYSEIPPQEFGEGEPLEFGELPNLRCTTTDWKVAENWWQVANCDMD